jgi:predicted TPR repeat methyltransferase
MFNPYIITDKDRLDLKRLCSQAEDYVDNTANIRKLKHSSLIASDILKLQNIKRNSVGKSIEEMSGLCSSSCSFLYQNYGDIFDKILKDELDLQIFGQLLQVLEKIENDELDQEEGSFVCGKILKNLYVDSAIRHGDNLDKQRDLEKGCVEEVIPAKTISWKEWKIGSMV